MKSRLVSKTYIGSIIAIVYGVGELLLQADLIDIDRGWIILVLGVLALVNREFTSQPLKPIKYVKEEKAS